MKTFDPITLKTPEVRKWLAGGKIIASQEDQKHGCFYVVAEYEGGRYNNSEIRLYRFFHIGEQVECSCDVSAQSPNDFIRLALEKIIGH